MCSEIGFLKKCLNLEFERCSIFASPPHLDSLSSDLSILFTFIHPPLPSSSSPLCLFMLSLSSPLSPFPFFLLLLSSCFSSAVSLSPSNNHPQSAVQWCCPSRLPSRLPPRSSAPPSLPPSWCYKYQASVSHRRDVSVASPPDSLVYPPHHHHHHLSSPFFPFMCLPLLLLKVSVSLPLFPVFILALASSGPSWTEPGMI